MILEKISPNTAVLIEFGIQTHWDIRSSLIQGHEQELWTQT